MRRAIAQSKQRRTTNNSFIGEVQKMTRCMRVALVTMLLTIGVLAPAAASGIVTSSFVFPFAQQFNPGADNEPVC